MNIRRSMPPSVISVLHINNITSTSEKTTQTHRGRRGDGHVTASEDDTHRLTEAGEVTVMLQRVKATQTHRGRRGDGHVTASEDDTDSQRQERRRSRYSE